MRSGRVSNVMSSAVLCMYLAIYECTGMDEGQNTQRYSLRPFEEEEVALYMDR